MQSAASRSSPPSSEEMCHSCTSNMSCSGLLQRPQQQQQQQEQRLPAAAKQQRVQRQVCLKAQQQQPQQQTQHGLSWTAGTAPTCGASTHALCVGCKHTAGRFGTKTTGQRVHPHWSTGLLNVMCPSNKGNLACKSTVTMRRDWGPQQRDRGQPKRGWGPPFKKEKKSTSQFMGILISAGSKPNASQLHDSQDDRNVITEVRATPAMPATASSVNSNSTTAGESKRSNRRW